MSVLYLSRPLGSFQDEQHEENSLPELDFTLRGEGTVPAQCVPDVLQKKGKAEP